MADGGGSPPRIVSLHFVPHRKTSFTPGWTSPSPKRLPTSRDGRSSRGRSPLHATASPLISTSPSHCHPGRRPPSQVNQILTQCFPGKHQCSNGTWWTARIVQQQPGRPRRHHVWQFRHDGGSGSEHFFRLLAHGFVHEE